MPLLMPDVPDDPIDTPRCSRRGCTNDATVDLRWRNPSIHTAERVKHWLACPEHEQFLVEYLGQRKFLLDTAPLPPAGRSGSGDPGQVSGRVAP